MIVAIVIGGAGKLGYAKFNLNLMDGDRVAFRDLFSRFDRLGNGCGMVLLQNFYILCWTLLFFVPGIIKSYSYAMTPYILTEHPEMAANEAITASRRLMDGNKSRLFCLHFSFIGWRILCELPVAIAFLMFRSGIHKNWGSPYTLLWLLPLSISLSAGYLFLHPYEEAAVAAFYREISISNNNEEGTIPEKNPEETTEFENEKEIKGVNLWK